MLTSINTASSETSVPAASPEPITGVSAVVSVLTPVSVVVSVVIVVSVVSIVSVVVSSSSSESSLELELVTCSREWDEPPEELLLFFCQFAVIVVSEAGIVNVVLALEASPKVPPSEEVHPVNV